MKKFKLFKLILIILFFFKLILTPSFADNNLEIESKLWEALDKNLKKQGEQKQKEQEEEEQRQKEREEQKLKQEEEEQRQKERKEQKLKQEEGEQKLKQEKEEQSQKERKEAKALLSKLFSKNELSIIAKIGNEIVTSYDLVFEIKYLMALSPNIKSLTHEQKINLAKESIIREKVKINEILKYFKLGQEADYLDKVAAESYHKLGLKNEFEFGTYLSNYDLTVDDVKKKIEIEVLWNKLIYSKYRDQVEIDTENIKKKLKEEELKLKKQEVFLLSEILFFAKSKKELDKKYIKILKKEQEKQRQKEQEERKALLSNLFPKNELLIVAKVGNKIVTSYDLEIEIKYLEALSPNLKSLTQVQKISLAKESIIREKIKINEILRYFELGQEVDYLDKVTAETYRRLGLKNEFEFVNYLSNYDLTIDDIKKKIEIEVVWNKLIYSKYKNQVEIDTEKIKKKLKEEELKLKNQEVFLLSEILFNAKNKKELDKKYIKILKSIEEEGFKNTATIYSISDTAKFGGLIGWIQKNQLSDLVIDEILKINIGEFTKPINVPSGVLIIKIDEKKIKESEINLDLDLELKKMIQYEKNRKLKQFSFIHYKKIKNNIKVHEN